MKKCLIVTTLVAALVASIVSIRTFTAGKAVVLKRQAELAAVDPQLSSTVKRFPNSCTSSIFISAEVQRLTSILNPLNVNNSSTTRKANRSESISKFCKVTIALISALVAGNALAQTTVLPITSKSDLCTYAVEQAAWVSVGIGTSLPAGNNAGAFVSVDSQCRAYRASRAPSVRSSSRTSRSPTSIRMTHCSRMCTSTMRIMTCSSWAGTSSIW